MPGCASRTGARARPERFLLLLAAVLAAICTLAPFDMSVAPADALKRATRALQWRPLEAVELAGHFAAFFLLGCIAGAALGTAAARIRRGTFLAIAVSFCAALELAQLFQYSRHARLTDFMANLGGLLLGTSLSLHWPPVRRAGVRCRMVLRRFPVQFHSALLTLIAITWGVAGLQPALGGLRMDWRKEYHLCVGNEPDRRRPWQGEVRYAGVYGRALTPDEVERIYRTRTGSSPRQHFEDLGLLAGYDFTEQGATNVTPRGALASEELAIDLPKDSSWSAEESGGVLIRKGVLLRTRRPAAAMSEAIERSGEFSVEAWIQPSDLRQYGPARVITVSSGARTRNFTLGQQGAAMVFRVRNGINGTNGYRRQLQLRNTIDANLQHWIAVYDGGVSTLYRNGRRAGVADLRQPALQLHLGSGPQSRFITMSFVVLFSALSASALLHRIDTALLRHALALAIGMVLAAAPFLVTNAAAGGPAHFGFVSAAALAILLYPLAWSCTTLRDPMLLRPCSQTASPGT